MNFSPARKVRLCLLLLAIAGFLGINLPFLYFLFFQPEVYEEAMANGIAVVFMAEAFILMGLFAWLISMAGWRRPGWVVFIFLTLAGSLAFSVPFFLFLHANRHSD